MMHRKKACWICIFTLVGCFGFFSGIAQDNAKPLSLGEAIKEAIDHNRDVAISQLDEMASNMAYRSTTSAFLPQINLSYSVFHSSNPLNVFGFKLQQQVVTPSDFDPAILNNPSPLTDFATQISIQQPILNVDALYMRRAVLQQSQSAVFKTERLKDYLALQVTESYLQLEFLYRTRKVVESSLSSFRALYGFTRNRYEQGLLQKSDLLNAEVMVKSAETNLAEVQTGIRITSNRMAVLMGRSDTGAYVVAATAEPVVNIGETLPASRADFRAMESGLSAIDQLIKSNRMGNMPRINAVANYQFHDRSLFGFGGNGYLAGVQLSWDLFKGNSIRYKTSSLHIEKKKLEEQLARQKEESQFEINKARSQYADAEGRMARQTLAVSASEEACRVLQNRFQQGLVNTTEVLMAQTQLLNQQLSLEQSVLSRKMAAYYIAFLTKAK